MNADDIVKVLRDRMLVTSDEGDDELSDAMLFKNYRVDNLDVRAKAGTHEDWVANEGDPKSLESYLGEDAARMLKSLLTKPVTVIDAYMDDNVSCQVMIVVMVRYGSGHITWAVFSRIV